MKRFFPTVLAAFLAALLIAGLYRPATLEDQLLHLQVEQAMPEYAKTLSNEPAALQAVFLLYADDPVLLAKAHLALLRYPDIARPILLLYGDSAAFQDVLRSYGEDALLPIHYFLTNEILSLDLMRSANEATRSALDAAKRLWSDSQSPESPRPEPMSAEDRGRYAIHFLQDEGYDFIGQFVMAPHGKVAWVQTERVLEGINRFFAGGLRGLETKLRREESIGAGDIGWAALDVAIGVSAFKILRLGAGTAVGGRTLTFSQRSAALGAGLWRGSLIGTRLVKYGAPAVLVYMAVRHPSIINSLLRSAAEQLGLPVALVQVAGWTLVLFPVLLALRLLLGPLAWLLGGLTGLLRWSDRALGQRAGQQP